MDLKYLKAITGLLGVSLIFTTACTSQSIIGSGNIIKESRQVSGFHKVSVSGSGHLLISQGNTESLEIECDDNIAPHIRTIVRNGTLTIGPENTAVNPSAPIRYNLSLKDIDALTTSGSVLVKGGLLRTENLVVVMRGSGRFRLKNLEAQSIAFDISGSGKVHIQSGNSKNQTISISGSGEFSVPNLKCENIDLTISGSGNAKVWVTNELNIKISGSGRLYYYGAPVVSSRISGSGKVAGLGTK